MYARLAFRNAKHALSDYMIYMFTQILLFSMMFFSLFVAQIGKVEAGLQTASLPMVIVLISILLVRYIHDFMFKQRAKEFAGYLLLGMEQPYIIRMFILEFVMISTLCFLISILFDIGCVSLFGMILTRHLSIMQYTSCFLQTLLYFVMMLGIASCFIYSRMKHREIAQLLVEKRRNQKTVVKQAYYVWRRRAVSSFTILYLMIIGISFGSQSLALPMISCIAIPLIIAVYSFYHWLFLYLDKKRSIHDSRLYQKDHLYLAATETSGYQTNSLLNSLFCLCLLFSIISFLFGSSMFYTESLFGNQVVQAWMGFLQICICIIFMILYFSILSLKIIIASSHQRAEIKLMKYLGKDDKQLELLLKKKTGIDLFLPVSLCALLLITTLPLCNHKLNVLLPAGIENLYLLLAALYLIGFFIFYSCYCYLVYRMLKKNLLQV